jgi:anti-anti-sigma regulatory factor
MNIAISKTEGLAPVSILHLEGKLDRANYESLIEEAKEIYDNGSRNLIIDLSKLTFISSAGLAALHQVALLFRGGKRPNLDDGWAAFRAIDRDRGGGFQKHVKLYSPSDTVREVIEITGFSSLFEIFTDLPRAKESFQQADPVKQSNLQ